MKDTFAYCLNLQGLWLSIETITVVSQKQQAASKSSSDDTHATLNSKCHYEHVVVSRVHCISYVCLCKATL